VKRCAAAAARPPGRPPPPAAAAAPCVAHPPTARPPQGIDEVDTEALVPLAAVLPANFRAASTGINIEIGDGPARRQAADEEARQASSDRRPSADDGQPPAAPAAPLKPAAWAAAKEQTNKKKGLSEHQKSGLEDCPVCLDEKADVQVPTRARRRARARVPPAPPPPVAPRQSDAAPCTPVPLR